MGCSGAGAAAASLVLSTPPGEYDRVCPSSSLSPTTTPPLPPTPTPTRPTPTPTRDLVGQKAGPALSCACASQATNEISGKRGRPLFDPPPLAFNNILPSLAGLSDSKSFDQSCDSADQSHNHVTARLPGTCTGSAGFSSGRELAHCQQWRSNLQVT